MAGYKEEMEKVSLDEGKKQELKQLYVQMNGKAERRMKAGKIVRPVLAVAASAAIVLFAGNIGWQTGNPGQQKGEETGAPTVANRFVVKASAADKGNAGDNENAIELTKEDVVPLKLEDGVQGTAFCSTEGKNWEDKDVAYSLAAPFFCEGENIEKVTYHINRGAFQIVSPEGKIEGKKYPKELNVPFIIRGEEAEKIEASDGGDQDLLYYSEYSVDYDSQLKNVNVCGVRHISNGDALFGDSLQREKEAKDKLLGDVVITCTVTYRDGTTQSRDIKIENRIMKMSEVEPGMESGEDQKEVFVTFGLK